MATGRLAGKSCAVTSAARGIGRGIAIRLAAEGAHVAVVDLDFDGAQQVVDEMGEAMLRTSFSQILNSSRDFSTAITDAGGRLVAQAEYIPVHVGAMPASVLATLEACGDDIHPGDVFLLHDPYFGGSQLPDLTACLPVFVGERLLCWALNRAHHSDIGGATHGAYHASATEIWQEGLRASPRSRRRSGSRPARSSPARPGVSPGGLRRIRGKPARPGSPQA